ncbi:hypothetical protein GCM10022403_096330 [Streptomyces coacervatus]|uniref:Uncharacterized protein n=1 Tax=Streptomyces coacervatus TaxID=647381 RepID=A0ABP7JND3_9ACTN|nr:hypothetical protein [Streptomyces coacervatus]MDF2264112.1 hypothetical protein [Streptomyces coacervatus]
MKIVVEIARAADQELVDAFGRLLRQLPRSAGTAAISCRSSAAPSWLVAQFPAPL